MENIWTQIGLLFLGWIGGMITGYLSGFKDEYFTERKRIATHKRNVASKVLDACHKNPENLTLFGLKTEDSESLHKTLTDLIAVDPDAGAIFKRYVEILSYGSLSITASKDELSIIKSDLISWANNIRVGKRS